jgi:hypothetical protein
MKVRVCEKDIAKDDFVCDFSQKNIEFGEPHISLFEGEARIKMEEVDRFNDAIKSRIIPGKLSITKGNNSKCILCGCTSKKQLKITDKYLICDKCMDKIPKVIESNKNKKDVYYWSNNGIQLMEDSLMSFFDNHKIEEYSLTIGVQKSKRIGIKMNNIEKFNRLIKNPSRTQLLRYIKEHKQEDCFVCGNNCVSEASPPGNPYRRQKGISIALHRGNFPNSREYLCSNCRNQISKEIDNLLKEEKEFIISHTI